MTGYVTVHIGLIYFLALCLIAAGTLLFFGGGNCL